MYQMCDLGVWGGKVVIIKISTSYLLTLKIMKINEHNKTF